MSEVAVLNSETVVGVVGAGAMGAGIAQVAAQNGHRVVIADAMAASVVRAKEGHAKSMAREVEKGRLTRDAADAVVQRVRSRSWWRLRFSPSDS